jgi:hypothetical protein
MTTQLFNTRYSTQLLCGYSTIAENNATRKNRRDGWNCGDDEMLNRRGNTYLQYGIWNSRHPLVIWFDNDREAPGIGGDKGGEITDGLDVHKFICVSYFQSEHERVQAVVAELEHFLVDSGLGVDGGTERNGVLGLHILRQKTAPQILHKPAQNRQKMLCPANVSWHHLLQDVVWQCWVPQPCIRYFIHATKGNSQQAYL